MLWILFGFLLVGFGFAGCLFGLLPDLVLPLGVFTSLGLFFTDCFAHGSCFLVVCLLVLQLWLAGFEVSLFVLSYCLVFYCLFGV